MGVNMSSNMTDIGGVEHPTPDEEPPSYEPPSYEAEFKAEVPQTMEAYSDTNRHTFYLCGNSKEDRLYAVTAQDSSGNMPPLGARPGILLHAGPTQQHRIIAAAGDEFISPNEYVAHGAISDIILSLDSANPGNSSKPSSTMRMKISEDGKIAFTYDLIVREESDPRADRFSWVGVKAGEPGFQYGGFKLVRPALDDGGRRSSDSSDSEVYHPPATYHDGDALVRLIFNSTFKLGHVKKLFTLQFTPEAGVFRTKVPWRLPAVISAVRIYQLKTAGRTGRGGTDLGDIFRGLAILRQPHYGTSMV
ncbi:hypothetical protein F4825DRAFT_470499 [Nemania diffusa]|nr:hypothetical protein F4825DRAFT_470499 [Nemania diffusa]